MVHAVGWFNKLRTGELKPAQPRSWLEFIPSMAALHTLWLMDMDPHNAINVFVFYEAKPLQIRCIVIWDWMLDWFWRRPEFFSAFISSGLFCFNCSPSSFASVIMPCRRGIPRRGSHSGNRGSLSRPAPQSVAPIALAPPSSPPLDQDRFLPNNSYQTSRFTFQSQLFRPIVTVNFTIFVSEEESTQFSSTPPVSSLSQDYSVLLGDLTGRVYHEDHMQEDAPVSEAPQQPDPIQEDALVCEPSQREVGILHLVTNPDGGEPVLDEDGLVTWVASTSQEKEVTPASPSHAD